MRGSVLLRADCGGCFLCHRSGGTVPRKLALLLCSKTWSKPGTGCASAPCDFRDASLQRKSGGNYCTLSLLTKTDDANICQTRGTSAILIHDDGLQLIPEEEREKRIAFYTDHNIGWVARPPHSSAADGSKRAGRFKKAPNMNYGLRKHLQILEAAGENDIDLEETVLDLAIEEMFEQTGRKWKPCARNAKSIIFFTKGLNANRPAARG